MAQELQGGNLRHSQIDALCNGHESMPINQMLILLSQLYHDSA